MRPHGLIIFLLVLQGIDTEQIDEYFFTDYRTNGKPSTTKGYDTQQIDEYLFTDYMTNGKPPSTKGYDCGGEYNSNRGTVRHPLSGGNYANNENCTWIIRAASLIEITFVIFDTEEGNDYLYVRDGEGIESHALFRFSGDIVPSPVQTRTDTVILLFTSDTSNTRTGFEFHWRLSGPPEVSLNLQGGKHIYDEGTLVNASCHVRANPIPDISWRYLFCNDPFNCTDDYMNMASYITTDGNTGNLQFVSDNKMKSTVQFPAIRSGQLQCLVKNSLGFSQVNSRVIVRPEPLITAEDTQKTTEYMNTLSSDYWTTNESTATKGYVCGGKYNSSSGEIRHPSSGGNYQNKENCTWIIRAASPITITFVSFDTEAKYDYLYVRDGESIESQVLGKFSGDNVPSPVETNTNTAHLLFISDYSSTRIGFELHWESGCGAEYNSSSGEIHHPSSGGNYENKETCTWIIRAASPITITFVSFDTEARYDYLYVRDGESIESHVLGKFSGDNVPSPVETSTNTAHLLFTSDSSNTRIGFELHWEPSGPTVSPNLNWLTVGSDRFVRFAQEMNWINARALCQSHGLELYQPRDVLAVATYLEDNFSDKWYWLGARGNGSHQLWLSGDVLTMAEPWNSNNYENVGTNQCVYAITWNREPSKGTVLGSITCTDIATIDVLCG